jgi:flavodoxin
MTVNETKMLIIYGSQTGQSKSIAENLASEAGNRNYNIELLSMEEASEKVSNLKVQFFSEP